MIIVTFLIVKPSVVTLNVVMLTVVAPWLPSYSQNVFTKYLH